MATEQISVRLKTLKTIRAVAKELDRSISAVLDASIDEHAKQGLPRNAGVIESLARIGKKMAPPEAVKSNTDCCFGCGDIGCFDFDTACWFGWHTKKEAADSGDCAECEPCNNFTPPDTEPPAPKGAAKP